MLQLATISLGVAAATLALVSWKLFQRVRSLEKQYSQIIDVDAELAARRRTCDEDLTRQRDALNATRQSAESDVAMAQQRLQQLRNETEALELESRQRRASLSKEYEDALSTYKNLKLEISFLEENLEDISFGLYKPHFTFQTAEEYKRALERLRDEERQLVRNGGAATCAVKWTVADSAKDGERMAKQYTKLLIRAFNGECDAAVANVMWNNITKMEARVRKAFDALNELGDVMKMSLTLQFLNLKLNELRLTHEYEEKRQQEREEQRRIREQIRDEEKAQRELGKAQEDAEKDEFRYNKALEQARQELEKARSEAAATTNAQLQKLTAQVQSFEAKLDEARKKKERAISRAQLTKSGFVYVISNVGAFGDRVVKIGMTRRMEPMERIIELGDASVPFPFDLHAMLYSDNAPELENSLHQFLADRRVNMVNARKEFYHSVELDEIEAFVKTRGLSAQFIKLPEAKEYRETLAMRDQKKLPQETTTERFSPALLLGPE
jgi:hypothetical protein